MNLFGFLLSWSERQQAPLIGTTYSPGQFFFARYFWPGSFSPGKFFFRSFSPGRFSPGREKSGFLQSKSLSASGALCMQDEVRLRLIFGLCSLGPRKSLPHTWFINDLWKLEQTWATSGYVHNPTYDAAQDCSAACSADQQTDLSRAACDPRCPVVCPNCWNECWSAQASHAGCSGFVSFTRHNRPGYIDGEDHI